MHSQTAGSTRCTASPLSARSKAAQPSCAVGLFGGRRGRLAGAEYGLNAGRMGPSSSLFAVGNEHSSSTHPPGLGTLMRHRVNHTRRDAAWLRTADAPLSGRAKSACEPFRRSSGDGCHCARCRCTHLRMAADWRLMPCIDVHRRLRNRLVKVVSQMQSSGRFGGCSERWRLNKCRVGVRLPAGPESREQSIFRANWEGALQVRILERAPRS